MQFAVPRRRPRSENIVPMINVVFLLLIFFLMTAQIAPPDPFEVSPPAAKGDPSPPRAAVVLVDAGGGLAFAGQRDTAVFAALATLDRATPLLIRADGKLPARDLAALLPRIAALGFTRVSLATVPIGPEAR